MVSKRQSEVNQSVAMYINLESLRPDQQEFCIANFQTTFFVFFQNNNSCYSSQAYLLDILLLCKKSKTANVSSVETAGTTGECEPLVFLSMKKGGNNIHKKPSEIHSVISTGSHGIVSGKMCNHHLFPCVPCYSNLFVLKWECL